MGKVCAMCGKGIGMFRQARRCKQCGSYIHIDHMDRTTLRCPKCGGSTTVWG